MVSKRAIATGMLVLMAAAFIYVFAIQSPEPSGNINIAGYASVASRDAASALLSTASAAESTEKESTEVTVYNQNIALVKETRSVKLEKGYNTVRYVDVASLIDPTSVLFYDLSQPDTEVLEQNYEYDIVNREKLLSKYLDRDITITSGNVTYTGKLLGTGGGIILETNSGVITLDRADKIEFPDAAGLLTKPTLVWYLQTDSAGEHRIQTTYLTNGMNWNADYVLKVGRDDSAGDLKGWVTVDNRAGTSYPNAKLKLVAGDVNMVYAPKGFEAYRYPTPVATAAAYGTGFVEKPLFEYHIYSLGRKTDIGSNEIKQISLLRSDGVKLKKELVYDGAYYGDKVRVMLEFANSESNGLGVPLPGGRVRAYKEDTDGQLQFLGEDSIDHKPKDEKVRVHIGDAFDVVGTRTQTDYRKLGENAYEYSFKIELRNHKTEAVDVTVVEHLHGSWRIISSSDAYTKKDANTIEFSVNVGANATRVITYTADIGY
ncbi:MAG TPA: DUF4139 domain-containing protein [Candidatus Methanoperedenaceae archaeon]|nr:DUF4139 domain-containing protein [Candidatus Methanoperedenaceae archaeon]